MFSQISNGVKTKKHCRFRLTWSKRTLKSCTPNVAWAITYVVVDAVPFPTFLLFFRTPARHGTYVRAIKTWPRLKPYPRYACRPCLDRRRPCRHGRNDVISGPRDVVRTDGDRTSPDGDNDPNPRRYEHAFTLITTTITITATVACKT